MKRSIEFCNRKLLTASFGWALFTTSSPSSSHRTTALRFGHGGGSWIQAGASAECVEAELLADVDALFAVGAEDVAARAFAPEASLRVDAVAVLAEIQIRRTFVDIYEIHSNVVTKTHL